MAQFSCGVLNQWAPAWLETEKRQLLEAVARDRLAKIQKAEKGLASAVVICVLWT
jgi:hypothetical protein